MNDNPIDNPQLASLRDGDAFEGFYAVRESSFQTASNGKNYIRMTLADASASLPANIWDANRELFNLCPAGSIAKILGVAESYKGKQQIRVNRFRPAHESEVDPDRFLPRSAHSLDAMRDETLALVDSLRDPHYAALGKAFFHDTALMDAFARSPAARDLHHAFIGGLMEHTLNIARMADAFAAGGKVDRDLLLLGSLLHDIGKIEELEARFAIDYTDKGKLLGHLFIGAEMAARRAGGVPGFPQEKLLLVQHLILAHHGKYEYGSPVLPKIPEAFALHHLDNLDAKVEAADRLIGAINDPEKNWTEFSRALETQLFRKPV